MSKLKTYQVTGYVSYDGQQKDIHSWTQQELGTFKGIKVLVGGRGWSGTSLYLFTDSSTIGDTVDINVIGTRDKSCFIQLLGCHEMQTTNFTKKPYVRKTDNKCHANIQLLKDGDEGDGFRCVKALKDQYGVHDFSDKRFHITENCDLHNYYKEIFPEITLQQLNSCTCWVNKKDVIFE